MPEALDFMRGSNILKQSGFTDSGLLLKLIKMIIFHPDLTLSKMIISGILGEKRACELLMNHPFITGQHIIKDTLRFDKRLYYVY